MCLSAHLFTLTKLSHRRGKPESSEFPNVVYNPRMCSRLNSRYVWRIFINMSFRTMSDIVVLKRPQSVINAVNLHVTAVMNAVILILF